MPGFPLYPVLPLFRDRTIPEGLVPFYRNYHLKDPPVGKEVMENFHFSLDEPADEGGPLQSF